MSVASLLHAYTYVMGELRDYHPHVMGWSSYWFILPVLATSAFSWTQRSVQMAGLVLERSKGPLK